MPLVGEAEGVAEAGVEEEDDLAFRSHSKNINI